MLVMADSPMAVDHTYSSKEIVLIIFDEEANYSGFVASIGKSDQLRVQAFGRNGSSFVVKVVCSDKFGWRVAQCETHLSAAMICDVATAEETQAGVVTEGGTLHDNDAAIGDEGAADIDDDRISTPTRRTQCLPTHLSSCNNWCP